MNFQATIPSWSRRVSTIAAASVFAAGLITFLGYVLNLPRLTDWIGSGISAFPNTAICSMLSAAALFLINRQTNVASRNIARCLAVVVFVIAALTLCQHLFDVSFGIDTLLFNRPWGQRASAAPMRMGPPASTSFTILGISLLLATGSSRNRRLASLLALSIMAIASLSLVGYWFGANQLFVVSRVTGIAFQTSTILAGLSIGLIFALPEFGFIAMIGRQDASGFLARRLLPPIIALPLILGWLRILGQKAGYFDTPFGVSILALITIALLIGLLSRTAAGISHQAEIAAVAEERFRLAVEASPAGMVMVDEQGKIVLINSQTERLFGYDRHQLLGQPVEMLVPARYREQHERFRAEFLRTPLKRAMGVGRDLFGLCKDGSEIPIEVGLSVITMKEQNLILSSIVDITERKRAGEALAALLQSEKAARAEAETANLAKDQFLAMVSHELRTPLNAILGWTHLLKSGALEKQKENSALNAIYDSAKIQAQIIDDLLDVARISSGKLTLSPEKVQITQIVLAAIDILRVAVNAKNLHVRFQYGTDAEAMIVYADPQRLQQVFWNVLSNAVKFTPSGGSISVDLQKTAAGALITIQDSGRGMSPEFLPHIFERFRQADSSSTRIFGGLGLGLSISKEIVELHGGTIQAQSEGEGKGSTFIILLPDHQSDLVIRPSATKTQPSRQIKLTNRRVLVVDDDRYSLHLLREIFRFAEADARFAESAAEALRLFESFDPEIVLSDIAMPVHDGYWLIRQVRTVSGRGSAVPAIALTAFATIDEQARAIAAGFDTFLPKPIEPDEMLKVVSSLLKSKTTKLVTEKDAAPVSSPQRISVLKGAKILLVEDDLISSASLMLTLEHANAFVRSAATASEGLRIIKDWKPRVLISDLGLPDQDGISFIQNIRKVFGIDVDQLLAVALTGYSEKEGKRALAAGFQKYQTKPVNPDSILKLVAEMLEPS